MLWLEGRRKVFLPFVLSLCIASAANGVWQHGFRVLSGIQGSGTRAKAGKRLGADMWDHMGIEPS